MHSCWAGEEEKSHGEREKWEQMQRHVNPWHRVQRGNGEGQDTKVGWDQVSIDHHYLAKVIGLYHRGHKETPKGLYRNIIRLCQKVREYNVWRQGGY